jgi:hypothetical protein
MAAARQGNGRSNDGSVVGKCNTCNSKYFEINPHTTAMAMAITAPAVEAVAQL